LTIQLLHCLKSKLRESLQDVVHPDIQGFNSSLSFSKQLQAATFLLRKVCLNASQASATLVKHDNIQNNNPILKIQFKIKIKKKTKQIWPI